MDDLAARLTQHGIRPSSQRLAVASYVLATDEHPTAERVHERTLAAFPSARLSKATVYNTLHLLVKKGLLRELSLVGGHSVYDPNLERHHHFIDDRTGRISDLPWEMLRVHNLDAAEKKGFEVRAYEVVARGRRKGR